MQEYNFFTDGNGHLIESHPPTKCEPPKRIPWELALCVSCDKLFDPTPVNGGPRRVVCSEVCREARARLAAHNRISKRKLLREQAKAAGRTDQWYNKKSGNPVGRPKRLLPDSEQLSIMGIG